MPTNRVGKGTKTIGLKMPMKTAKELERRAKSMGVSTGKYCKIVLFNWLASGEKLTLSE